MINSLKSEMKLLKTYCKYIVIRLKNYTGINYAIQLGEIPLGNQNVNEIIHQ